MDAILVVNAGSSSLKFQVFSADDASTVASLAKGQIDGIGSKPRLRAATREAVAPTEVEFTSEDIPDLPSAIRIAAKWLREASAFEIVAVGHRVVHGGPEFAQPIVVDGRVLAELERYTSLAPLHQPNNLAPIRALRAQRPELPQVACFDTAFHRQHGPLADQYAIPHRFYAEGVRRYGFHGLSYEYVSGRLRQIAPQVAAKRVIIAHLGSGASMCALRSGRSVESTMGFTALDGLPMGTRPGQIDAGVVLYLIAEKGMTAAAVQDLLYRECGLKGLSGISSDMRELDKSTDPRAQFAVDYFVHRVALHAGMLAAALEGLEAFVFTAGMGENSPGLRARIADKLAWLGVSLDAEANATHETLISSSQSRVPVYVIPTDEELMIARHTLSLLSTGRTERVSRAASAG
jgi:acetate kinase